MATHDARFALGIDLGTTHTVVAVADLEQPAAGKAILDLDIPQTTAPSEVQSLAALPSVLYLPAPGELGPDDVRLPFGPMLEPQAGIVGSYARDQGARVPGRVVTSAKSWLSVGGVDRTAAILPWAAAEDVARVSPVEVQRRLLAHVHDAARAWLSDKHPGAEFGETTLTIPASFDEVARELTLQAAHQAGLPDVRLVEEPQAAFQALLSAEAGRLKDLFAGVRVLLVLDVGGGTSDFTLLSVAHDDRGQAPPRLVRLAVGEHLMLGGDNMDVTLARQVEQKLTGAVGALDAVSFAQLVLSARLAKETLLSDHAPEEFGVTLLSRGSKLLSGQKTSVESRAQVQALLLDGFLPVTAPDDLLAASGRLGLSEFGLPYARDPALPRHIATFLARHQPAAAEAGARIVGALPRPDAVLLNGGVFRAPAVRARLKAVFARWFGDSDPVRFLDVADVALDRAVARGAAAMAQVRRGRGLRITSGSARAYFIGVDDDHKALCVVPRGLHEGETVEVDRTFRVTVDKPVGFPLFTSTWLGQGETGLGSVVALDSDAGKGLTALPALATVLPAPKEVPVRLRATLTEVGTLELRLQMAPEALESYRLDFSTRSDGGDAGVDAAGDKRAQAVPPAGPVHKRIDEGKDLILGFFGNKSKDVDPKRVKDLRRDLEKIFGPREQWSVGLARELGGALLSGTSKRRRSADHERAFFQNLGFCLRPGYGAPFDDWRLEQLWPLWAEGVQYVSEKPGWASWFILWRRVAGGLDATRQQAIWSHLKPWLLEQGTGKKGQGPTPHGQDEMIRLAASLERIPATEKSELTAFILKKLGRGSIPSYWPLGKVGARVPLHGSAHDVLPVADAETCIHTLLGLDLKAHEGAPFALAQLARKTGDRARDIDDALREKVVARLQKAQAQPSWIQMVQEVTDLSGDDASAAFGEQLPVGLHL